jgi:peroxiredoxin Q/BCP
MLAVGDTVPEFTLLDQHGKEVKWSSFRGKPVVVFFYPKADTPGCTREACDYRDARDIFKKAGAQVVGVSADAPKRQAAFADKYDLPMPLLSDPDHVVLEPWGVWGDKTSYGQTRKGIIRTTVLFDAKGKVAHVWSPVKVDGHVDKVIERIQQGV